VAQRELVVDLPDYSDSGMPIYANVSHVAFTPFDFRITFSLLPTPHDGHDDNPLVPESPPVAVAEIVMPVSAIGSLVELLKTELDDFTSRFGSPGPELRQARAS
jgi:hypothetical protein